MRILDRYIIRELIAPFFFGIGGYIIIMSVDPLIEVIQYIFVRHADPWTVFKWYSYKVFSGNMVYSFSMATLLATFLVFGRLAKDNEISAILAGGISFKRILIPVFFFGIFVSGLAFGFINFIAPHTNANYKKIEDHQILLLPYGRRVVRNVLERLSTDEFIYAENVNSDFRRIYNAVIFKLNNGEITNFTTAKFADFTEKGWIFYNGRKVEISGRRFSSVEKYYQERMDLGIDFMKLTQTEKEKKKFSDKGMFAMWNEIKDLMDRGAVNIHDYKVEFYLKLALPFAVIIFSMAGASLGVYFKRSGLMVGLGLSVIIIFFYYVMLSITRSYGISGRLNPVAAAWSANVLFIAATAYFIKKADI